jgi:patatin-related protein
MMTLLTGRDTPPQVLRLAVVITGGVSLAVWMGGVAREINLLVQAGSTNPPPAPSSTDGEVFSFYGDLCGLLDWQMELDILAGTSAGGINAALLALCNATGGNLSGLRDLWLDNGAFLNLLRDPAEKSPPSLMKGDGVLLAGIAGAVDRIRSQAFGETAQPDTLLHVTTTLLNGEPTRFQDTFGTSISDSDHLGLFTFTSDDLVDENSNAALALAARSSASFPGAFEPAFLPAGSNVNETHPNMSAYLGITEPHFASDGGQLENQPVAPALQAIFDRPEADDPVRRVMLYVVPSSSPPTPVTPEKLDDPPSLLKALMADFQASRSQSIKSALEEIQSHNAQAAKRQDGWIRLVGILAACPSDPLDAETFRSYCQARADATASEVVTALITTIMADSPGVPAPDLVFGQLASTASQSLTAAGYPASQAWPPENKDDSSAGSFNHLGLVALDDLKAMLLSMRRWAYLLIRLDEPDLRTAMRDAWSEITWSTGGPARQTKFDQTLHKIVGDAWSGAPDASSRAKRAKAAAVTGALKWAEQQSGPLPDSRNGTPQSSVWERFQRNLPDFVALASRIIDEYRQWGNDDQYALGRNERDAAAESLSEFCSYLSQTPLERLVAIHVISYLLLPTGRVNSQPVEFVQVSADTRTTLDPKRDTAASKLTGMQVEHFGAFYRGSWRASDWMWGRLDGAGWLVHILLSPKHLIEIRNQYPKGFNFAEALLSGLQNIVGGEPPGDVTSEINNLLDATTSTPLSLPKTAMWVATKVQTLIAAEELASVAKELDSERGDVPASTAEASFLTDYRAEAGIDRAQPHLPDLPPPVPIASAGKLLRECPVSGEKLAAQVGSPLFTKTTVKAAAVAVAAIEVADTKPPAVLKPAFGFLRHGTRWAYEVVNQVTQGRPLATLLAGLGAIVVGIGLTTSPDTVIQGVGALALAAGVILLLAILQPAWKWAARILILLAAVALILAAAIRVIREHLFPWLENHALPWLSQHWWVWALIVLFILLPPISTVVSLVSGSPKKQKTNP